MNSFGRIFRLHIFGESHGKSIGVVLDGVPAGLPIAKEDFYQDLERRRGTGQRGTTPRKESDEPEFISGLFNGHTTGAPLTIIFHNKDVQSNAYDKYVTVPRPGHADWVAGIRAGGFQDHRGGGHFSGRLTVALVAAGVVAKKMLSCVSGHVISCHAVISEIGGSRDIDAGIERAIKAGDSVGGIVECRVKGLPPALGEPFFDSAESLISHAVFSIPAIRGIEFGTGFAAARMFGSEHNDAITSKDGSTSTNHAGGISGGLTNGNEMVFRVAVKPTSSTPKEQSTLNIETGEMEEFSVQGRHDLCIALRVPPVIEAVISCVLADLLIISGHLSRVIENKNAG
jgi:chorismate synthase